jgi:2-dehydro-3-deoxyphosphogluconate aldolase/(4S)-4-hydroxy-2-oxoglutarate aldolase
MLLGDMLARVPVIPVLVISDLGSAVPLATALVEGGLSVLEVTLRTPCALQAISDMASALPQAIIGAGTVLQPAQAEAAAKAGAKFLVSPGFSTSLSRAAPVPLLPGISTATEAMAAMDAGHDYAKLFPAEVVGGVRFLKAMGEPIPQLRFCPTGGITRQTAPDYLALSNVVCVGGSWVAPRHMVEAGDFAAIKALAADAASLARSR